MRYFKKIVGNKVYLSPINSDDYLKYVEWLNNYEIAKGVDAVAKVPLRDEAGNISYDEKGKMRTKVIRLTLQEP